MESHSQPPTPMPRFGHLPQPATVPASPTSVAARKSKIAWLHRSSVPGLEPVLTSPCLSSRLCPQDFLLAFPERAALGEVITRLSPVRAPPALSSGLLLLPHEVLASEAVARLQLVVPRSEPLVGVCWARARLLARFPESAVPFLPRNLGLCPPSCHYTSVTEPRY